MFYTIADYIKRNPLLDRRMVDYLSRADVKYCDCGNEHIINDTMTELRCSNENCNLSNGRRLLQFFKDLQYKGIGIATCNDLCSAWDFNNPLNIFMYSPDDGPLLKSMNSEKTMEVYKFLQKVELPMWQFIRLANIGIRDNALKVAGDFQSFKSFYDFLETQEKPVLYISKKLGHSDIGISALNTYEALMQYKDSFLEVEPYLNIKQRNKLLVIAISKELSIGLTKDEFVKRMSQKYDVDIHRVDSVSKSIFCLINDDGDKTIKVRKAESMGVPIYTSSEFTNILEKGEY